MKLIRVSLTLAINKVFSDHIALELRGGFFFVVNFAISHLVTTKYRNAVNLLAPELFFFLILAHPVYKM